VFPKLPNWILGLLFLRGVKERKKGERRGEIRKGGKEGRRDGRDERGKKKGGEGKGQQPPIHISGYATGRVYHKCHHYYLFNHLIMI